MKIKKLMLGIPIARRFVPRVETFSGMALHYGSSLAVTFALATLVYFFLERPYLRRRHQHRGQ